MRGCHSRESSSTLLRRAIIKKEGEKMYKIARAFKVFKNRWKYKNSPAAIKQDIQTIVNSHLLRNPLSLIKDLEEFEGVVEYDYNAKGCFEATLAGGSKVRITCTITDPQ